MRKPTDICLLCETNPAVKTNSHIFPKFLSTKFLGTSGQARRGYVLNSDTILDNKPKVIQDSPKEDYILCEDCETYFSVLEGIASDLFTNWQAKVASGEYTSSQSPFGIDIVDCKTADKRTIYLLIYSIFWRVSISELDLFENMNITKEFEDELRATLLSYKQIKKSDYLIELNKTQDFKIYPTSIITSESFTDNTPNMLYAPFSYDPYCIVVDRFAFMLFKKVEEIENAIVGNYSNVRIDDCKIIIFPNYLWESTILKSPYDHIVNQANKK